MKNGQFEEGDRIVTVGNAGSTGGYSYKASCVYEATARRDGVLTWRKVTQLNDRTAGSGISINMINRAKAHAQRMGIPYVPDIRQNDECNNAGIVMLNEIIDNAETLLANSRRHSII